MSTALLHSIEAGELLAALIEISPKLLEEILEALAEAPFPINPELDHSTGGISRVRFPLYESQREDLNQTLIANGFSPELVQFRSVGAQLVP